LPRRLRETEGHLHPSGNDGIEHSGVRLARGNLLAGLPAVSRLARFCLAAAGVAGCVTQYTPPTQAEPHAILKLRRTYESQAGTALSERVNIQGEAALLESAPSRVAVAARDDALLVRPQPVLLEFIGTFSHDEYKRVQETYYEREPYTAYESYSCGTYSSPRTCSRSVTRYRSRSKTRWVSKLQTVVDGTCSRSFYFAPRESHVYLAQFTYQDNNACSLSCFEQIKAASGNVEQRRCPSAASE
jgi:hypothetical protein